MATPKTLRRRLTQILATFAALTAVVAITSTPASAATWKNQAGGCLYQVDLYHGSNFVAATTAGLPANECKHTSIEIQYKVNNRSYRFYANGHGHVAYLTKYVSGVTDVSAVGCATAWNGSYNCTTARNWSSPPLGSL